MSNQYSWEQIPLEQLQELIGEGINHPSLHAAYSTRLLMQRLPTLEYTIAHQLVTSHDDPSASDPTDEVGKLLSQALMRSMPFKKELTEIRGMLSPGGQKLFERAKRRYEASEGFIATEIHALAMMQDLAKLPEKTCGEDIEKKATDFAEKLPEDEAEDCRRMLRQNFGIEGPEDWYGLLEARQCIARTKPDLFQARGLKAARAFANAALRLLKKARAADMSPSAWIDYREAMVHVRNGTANPFAIIHCPNNRMIFGNGDPVRRSRDGQPLRTVIDIFGNEAAEGEEANIDDIQKMVKKAFKEQANKTNEKSIKRSKMS